MRWVLLVTLVACSQSSMAIEVHTSDPAVDHVELVIVKDQCTSDDCVGVAPPSSIAKPQGNVYYQIAGDRFVATVKNDVAGFRLEPGDDDYIPRLGAIGFDAQEKPVGIGIIDTDFHIADHLGEIFQLELAQHDIQQAEGVTFDVGPNDLVVVWRAPNAPATAQSCVAIQPQAGTASFIVPEGDPDCDGITGHDECDPFWFKYVRPTSPADQACFAQHSTSEPCIVGRETKCVDGQPDGCTGGTYCVPAVTCDECSSVFDPSCLDKVAMAPEPETARITCQVPILQQGPMLTTCPGASPPIGLDTQFGGADCKPGFLARTLTLPATPQSQLSFDTGVGNVTLQMVMSGLANCSFQIAMATTPYAAPPSEQIPGVVVLHGSAGHDLLIPLVLDFAIAAQVSCGSPDTKIFCSITPPTEPIWTCAAH